MILVNGEANACVDAHDRGLAYGDGVFRTLRTEAGEPLWWADHYAKLRADCAALALDCPAEDMLREDIRRIALAGSGVVKIIVTRGSGTRGYLPARGVATRIVMSARLPPHAAPGAPVDVRVRWCSLRLSRQPQLAGIKHLNRLENVLARAEWDDPDIFEGLLCDDAGAIIGGVMTNVFWVSAGELFTPDLGTCGVAGVARARVLRAAARRGLRARVERLPSAAILAADEVMICNSLIGVRRVARLGDKTWMPAGWTDTLNAALYEDLV
ncbi:4-amino-4-deoxychorismate lyase [Thiobacillus denitrificans ATCC 25259]|uniref:aminodeoxychorismate lyase n=1 Tax=Thiobacillus denitrificans (strain ATCC 25259 / T1) TaxID=292415 RepID=Q3SIM7_THIDA|nr:aminodeoxychorismate lyase [Thiobacillus denitrificans]AAZ97498.1 4-amino-4-deoxychorismate lyase [Thiobacillus denitrificans ATCC 25259]